MFVSRYFADEYGYVRGAVNMKKEIMKRGPIGKYFNIFFLKNIFASKSLSTVFHDHFENIKKKLFLQKFLFLQ